MDRRTFLAATGAGLSVALAGCSLGGGEDRAGTTDRSRTPGDATGTPGGAHDLYVENFTSRTETARIGVVRADGTALVDGRYELPDERGLEFEDLAAWETTYTIELAIDGADPVSLEWYTRPCGPDSEAPGESGSRNAFVRLEAGAGDVEQRVSLVVDQCDALYGPEVPVGPAESFRLDE